MLKFGDKLKAYREELGLSLQQVKEKTGITTSRLSKMEREKISCPPEDLKKLARVYGVQTILLFMEANYLDENDISEYQQVFYGVSKLNEEERKHIQEQIDLFNKKKEE